MLGKQQEFNLKLTQLIDSAVVALAFWTSYHLRMGIAEPLNAARLAPLEAYLPELLVLVPFTPLVLEMQGFYTHPLQATLGRRVRQILTSVALVLVVISVVTLMRRVPTESRSVLLIFSGVCSGMLLIRELITRSLTRKHNDRYRERVVLAGPPGDVEKMLARLGKEQLATFDIVDTIDISTEPLTRLIRALHEKAVERVIFATAHVHFRQIEEAVAVCETVGVESWIWSDFIQTSIARPTFDALGGRPMLVFRCTPEVSWEVLLKTIIDKAGALFGCVVLALAYPFIALGIKLSSKGPVIFTQMRSGRYGRPFKMYKFRTMVPDAEARKAALMDQNQMSGPVFKIDRDPRIFKFGAFLRKFSIDEWPQIINVLKGDMSLVGPRPLPVYEVEKFADAAHRRRLSVKPGLTCLWQISGRNDITDFDQWVELDLKYIDNWSIGLDIKILFMTLPAVLFGSGAR